MTRAGPWLPLHWRAPIRRLRYRPGHDARPHDAGRCPGPDGRAPCRAPRPGRGRGRDARSGSRGADDDARRRDPVLLDRLGKPRRPPARAHPRRHVIGPDLVAGRARAGGERPAGHRRGPARPRTDWPLDGSPSLPRQRGGRRRVDACGRTGRARRPGRGAQLGCDDHGRVAVRRDPPDNAGPGRPAGHPARGHRRDGERPVRGGLPGPRHRGRGAVRREPGPGATSSPRRRRSSSSTSRRRARSCSTTAIGTADSRICRIRPRPASLSGSSAATRAPAGCCRMERCRPSRP